MRQQHLFDMNGLFELARLAKMDQDPTVQRMMFNLGVSKNKNVYNALVKQLRFKALIEKLDGYPFSHLTEEQMFSGVPVQDQIQFGQVKNSSVPFVINAQDLAKHCVVFGGTGSGKTTWLMHMIKQCIDKGIRVFIFDTEKRDYRGIFKIYKEFLVFDLSKNFKFNVMQPPPGVSILQWIITLVQVFCKTHSLLNLSEALLIKEFKIIFQRYGSFDNSGVYPSLLDFYDQITKRYIKGNSNVSRSRDSIVARLDTYLETHADVFDCSTGFPIQELFENNVVIDFGTFTEDQKRFLSSILMYWIFLYRIAKGDKGMGLRNAIIMDEGKFFAPKVNNSSIAFSAISYLYDQFRAYGVGLCLATHSPHYLEESVFVNSYHKVSLSLGTGEENTKIKRIFQMNDEQCDYLGGKLGVGEGIVHCPRFGGEPFVVQVPPFQP